MDKLRYINALGQEVEFSAESSYRWLSVDDLGGAEITQQVVQSPYQDGSTAVGDVYFQPRVLQVKIIIVSDEKDNRIRDLNNRLNPRLGMGKLVYQVGEYVRVLDQVKVRRLPTLPDGNQSGKRYQITQITFEAFDPLYTDEDPTELTVSSGAGTFTFPLNITDEFEFNYLNSDGVVIENAGDVETPVIITVDGPITAPLVIENLTTEQQITVALDLLDAERLTITTGVSDLDVTKTDLDTGEVINAFSYLDIGGTDFFQLARGPNSIRVTADGSSVAAAQLSYKNRYVGL
jgi:hypothetical protein